MTKPIALVIGATGAQGGSVARALEDQYTIRTITRDASKASAVALKDKGYEVIQGNISDSAVVAEALKGAELVFLVTQFWETFDKAKEVAEGKVFLDQVAIAKPKYFFFSTLENVAKETNGAITRCAHFDGKGELMDYCVEKAIPAVFIMMAAYFENFLGFFVPQKQADGSLALTLPQLKALNGVSVAEAGLVVKGIIPKYDQYVNKRVPVVSELAPVEDYCTSLSKAVGAKVVSNPVPAEVFAGFGFPGAEDLADMFKWYNEPKCVRETATTLSLAPNATRFEAWALANADKIKAAWKL